MRSAARLEAQTDTICLSNPHCAEKPVCVFRPAEAACANTVSGGRICEGQRVRAEGPGATPGCVVERVESVEWAALVCRVAR